MGLETGPTPAPWTTADVGRPGKVGTFSPKETRFTRNPGLSVSGLRLLGELDPTGPRHGAGRVEVEQKDLDRVAGVTWVYGRPRRRQPVAQVLDELPVVREPSATAPSVPTPA